VNTHRNKIVPIVIGAAVAIFAISMALRFVLFTEYGIPSSYLLFGLPGAGIGLVLLLLRLGVFTSGHRSSGIVGPWQQVGSPQNLTGQPLQYLGAPAPAASQHLQELDRLWQTGTISPADYAARRQQIISTI
jgi:hypothetical protein